METCKVESALDLGDNKATNGMKSSLKRLLNLLKCPLCDELFDQPTTLSSCGHSFCVSCIDQYSTNACVCPVEGCRMPMSLVGGHGGSFRKVNPQLAQTVESVKLLCQKLNQCDDDWWKTASKEYTLDTGASQEFTDTQQLLLTDPHDNEEAMVDLQASPSLLGDDDSSDEEEME
ncbi:unnamed protein product [Cylindrotheca closterium]|uniref:RING-type domain-containing protein n=1 Tax=Cylindrotheca closterium TaxID=2856 RepID=A0AAD2CBZ9_9STRA|nr:unnamed protein product [Cylindrotheca closterium]